MYLSLPRLYYRVQLILFYGYNLTCSLSLQLQSLTLLKATFHSIFAPEEEAVYFRNSCIFVVNFLCILKVYNQFNTYLENLVYDNLYIHLVCRTTFKSTYISQCISNFNNIANSWNALRVNPIKFSFNFSLKNICPNSVIDHKHP